MTERADPEPQPSANTFAIGALAVSMLVLVIKLGAWLWTGSVVLMADAAESGLDMVTALLLVLAVRLSSRPPDEGHPWGHGKVEYFSTGFQGALILAAGGWVGVEAMIRVGEDPAPLELGPGLALSVLATAINLVLSLVLVRAGRRLRSPALEADGHHNAADVVTTLGGWAGLGLAWATGWWLLDPLVALLVAGHILWTGFGLARTATAGLMDASLPPEVLSELNTRLDLELAHDGRLVLGPLRARQSSERIFVDCVLYVPGAMSVRDAHDLCDRLEVAAAEALEGAEIRVHVEPLSEAEGR